MENIKENQSIPKKKFSFKGLCSAVLTKLINTPLYFKIIAVLTAICAVIHLLTSFMPKFADFIVRYPNAAVRFLLAKISGILPFSLAEAVIILLPLIVITLLVLCIYISTKGSDRAYSRYLCFLLSVLFMIYSMFVLTLAPGYKGSTLASKIGLEQKAVSSTELYDTSLWLLSEVEALTPEISFADSGASLMPYSLTQMNEKLMQAYKKLADNCSFIPHLNSKLKFVILSEPMTYTHISGVYSFYTGEANINTNFPDYTIPYTAAHELAHQRGIAPENEANFVAFLACLCSDDSYIRYSGYVNMLEYCMSALYSASSEKYYEFYREIDRYVVGEFNSYSQFYDKYRDNVVADVSGTINDTYLQSQGQSAGSKSYGLVVDLTVAYFHTIQNSD